MRKHPTDRHGWSLADAGVDTAAYPGLDPSMDLAHLLALAELGSQIVNELEELETAPVGASGLIPPITTDAASMEFTLDIEWTRKR